MLELTAWAVEILRRADEAARRFNPDARVRLARAPAVGRELRAQVAPGAIQTELVDEAREGDATVDLGDGTTIFVEAGIEGLIDVEEPHDRIVVRPAGSVPNPRGEH